MNAQNAAVEEPSSSQNKAETESEESSKSASLSASVPPSAQPQISEEDRKALENLATAIGIPQLVTEIKKQREEINMILTTLGTKSPGVGGPLALPGAASGFLKPILDKAPELIDGVMKWLTQGNAQQQVGPSTIKQEIMNRAVEQATKTYEATEKAVGQLASIIASGGSVMVDGNGNAVILKPKKEEKST